MTLNRRSFLVGGAASAAASISTFAHAANPCSTPIPITAAMIGSYVDLYRVKLGAAKRKSYSTVFKDFGYKGSDYRLKRSAETASHYTLPQLEACMRILLELDKSLKSQPVSAQTLLETALCRLAMAGGRR